MWAELPNSSQGWLRAPRSRVTHGFMIQCQAENSVFASKVLNVGVQRLDMLGVRMSLWREDAGLRGDGHSSDTGQGQRSRLEGTPVQEGRLQAPEIAQMIQLP